MLGFQLSSAGFQIGPWGMSRSQYPAWIHTLFYQFLLPVIVVLLGITRQSHTRLVKHLDGLSFTFAPAMWTYTVEAGTCTAMQMSDHQHACIHYISGQTYYL